MVDISPHLHSSTPRHSWSTEAAYRLSQWLVADSDMRLDWDADAGEEWSSLLVGDARVGMMSTSRPLAIYEGPDEQLAQRSAQHGLEKIFVA